MTGQHFVGQLRQPADAAPLAALEPGVVLLVSFDPAAREQLSLADDMAAVRSAFDQMLLHKGLLTHRQLDLIRNGTKARASSPAMRATGGSRSNSCNGADPVDERAGQRRGRRPRAGHAHHRGRVDEAAAVPGGHPEPLLGRGRRDEEDPVEAVRVGRRDPLLGPRRGSGRA